MIPHCTTLRLCRCCGDEFTEENPIVPGKPYCTRCVRLRVDEIMELPPMTTEQHNAYPNGRNL